MMNLPVQSGSKKKRKLLQVYPQKAAFPFWDGRNARQPQTYVCGLLL